MSVQESQPVNGSAANGHSPPAYSERMGNGQTESEQSLAILTPNDSVLEDGQGMTIAQVNETRTVVASIATNGHHNRTTNKDQTKEPEEGLTEARSASNSIKMSVVAQPSESNQGRSPVPAVFTEKELKLMKNHSPNMVSGRKRDSPGSPDAKDEDKDVKILQHSENYAGISGNIPGSSIIMAESGLTQSGTHQGFAVSEIGHSGTAYKIVVTNPDGQTGAQEVTEEDEPNPEPTMEDQANVRRISMRLYNLPPQKAPEGATTRGSINRLGQTGVHGHPDSAATAQGGRPAGGVGNGENHPAMGRAGDQRAQQPEQQPLIPRGKQPAGKEELFEMVNQVIDTLRRARLLYLSINLKKRKALS